MKAPGDISVYLAGSKTVDDWKALGGHPNPAIEGHQKSGQRDCRCLGSIYDLPAASGCVRPGPRNANIHNGNRKRIGVERASAGFPFPMRHYRPARWPDSW